MNLGVTIQPYKMAQIKMLTSREDTMMLGKILLQLQSKVNQVVAKYNEITCHILSDYLKFTLPMAYSMSIVSWGAIEWYQGYQLANQDSYLRDMIKWGTDWLIQAHPQPNVFYVQVSCREQTY
jgi:hypothetical protein